MLSALFESSTILPSTICAANPPFFLLSASVTH